MSYWQDEPEIEPSEVELYANDMGSIVRKRKMIRDAGMFYEAGRAITGKPRSSDRKHGAPHDYEMETYGEVYKKVEIVYRGINATADHVMQPGYRLVGGMDEERELLLDWTEYISFHGILHDVVRHLMIWGNCFIEVVKDDSWGVSELKLLDPDSMYVYASETGDIIGYIQHPKSKRWRGENTLKDYQRKKGRRQRRWKQEVVDSYPKAIVFDPDEIIHVKWNDMPDSYYGVSTIEPMMRTLTTYIGMLQDISVMIRRYGSPMIVWKLGTPEMPADKKMMKDFQKGMDQRNIGTDPVVPGIVEWDVVSAGERAMDIEPYVRSLRDDMFAGIAVPEIVLGGTSSGARAGSETQLEAFSRKISEIQKLIEDLCKNQIFPRVLGLGIKPFTRAEWVSIPNLIFNPPETTEQKYLRISTLMSNNLVTIEEAREMLDLDPELPDGERAIDLQVLLKKMGGNNESTRNPGDTGPPKSSDRDRDKTSAQEPRQIPEPQRGR